MWENKQKTSWNVEAITTSIANRYKTTNKGIAPKKALVQCDNEIVQNIGKVTEHLTTGNTGKVLSALAEVIRSTNGFIHYHQLLASQHGKDHAVVKRNNTKLYKHLHRINYITEIVPEKFLQDVLFTYAKIKRSPILENWLDTEKEREQLVGRSFINTGK